MSTGQYPRVTEFIATNWQRREHSTEEHPDGSDEKELALAGVDLILDGIESRIARLSGPGAR
ncbi:MAG: hypothetical protein ABJB47_09405 [Actinomycetota bacterium]